jgi:hypothetical protein
MYRRAVAIGLTLSALLGGFCYFHDSVINSGRSYCPLIPHLMPPVVFGGLIVAAIGLNPLLARLRYGWRLRPAEIAVMAGLALVACSIPFLGLVHTWPTMVMLPHHYNHTHPGWEQARILELAPARMLARPQSDETDALSGYVTGLGEGGRHIRPGQVPWGAWTGTLRFWLPLMLSFLVATLALALVLHQQWAHHEQLPYPLMRFASAFLGDHGGGTGPVTAQRGFWVAGACVFGLHAYNYLCTWWPGVLPHVALQLNFAPLSAILETMVVGGGGLLLHPKIILSVVGLAFFFASDVSFSLAVMPAVVCFVVGLLTHYGVVTSRSFLYDNPSAFMLTGGYFGVLLMILYTGRHYYWNVFCQSLGMRPRSVQPSAAVWSLRLALVAFVAFWLQLVVVGLNWLLALLFVGLAVMIILVNSRALAEAGAFYIGTYIMPEAILWGLLGSHVLGPRAMVIMGMLSVVFLAGPGWAAMCFGGQALQLIDRCGVRLTRAAPWGLVAAGVTLAVSLPAIIYWQYDQGVFTATGSGWNWAHYLAALPFSEALGMQQRLEAQGVLTAGGAAASSWLSISPNRAFLTAFLVTATLAVLVAVCRLRFPWWPLHPIAFVFLGTGQAQVMAFSFLLGWIIKCSVLRYGGGGLHVRLQPAMLGLIAGEILAAFGIAVAGVAYYVITGRPAASYLVLA